MFRCEPGHKRIPTSKKWLGIREGVDLSLSLPSSELEMGHVKRVVRYPS